MFGDSFVSRVTVIVLSLGSCRSEYSVASHSLALGVDHSLTRRVWPTCHCGTVTFLSRSLLFSLPSAITNLFLSHSPTHPHIMALSQSIAHTSCGERNLEKCGGPFSFHHHFPNQSMSLRHFGPYSHSCFPHRQSIITETYSTTHSLKTGFLVFTLRFFFLGIQYSSFHQWFCGVQWWLASFTSLGGVKGVFVSVGQGVCP